MQQAEKERRLEAERIAAIEAESARALEQDAVARRLARDKVIWALP